MKITASFVPARPRLAFALAAALWACALTLALSAAGLGVAALDARTETPRLAARLARVDEQLAAVSPREALPAAAELDSLHRRIQALNKVSGIRGWGTPRLLGWLGGQLPDNVYLVSLAHKPREGEALLVAESASAEALTAFLLRLEKEPRFAEVLLAKQGARGAPGAAAVQFEIRIRWKT